MASIVINGDTSGSVTLQAPATAGATVLTLPSTSGTVLTTASGQWITTGSDIYYNTGNVGIGTTTIGYKATAFVSSEDGFCVQNSATGTGSGNGFLFGLGSDSNARVWSYDANAILFGSGNTERMRIDSSGNVGIGTASPQTKLHVESGTIRAGDVGSTSGSVAMYMNYSGTQYPNVIGTMYSSAATLLGYGVRSSTVAGDAFLSTVDNVAWVRGALQLSDSLIFSNAASQSTAIGSAVTMTERFRITETGLLQFNSGYGSAATAYGCRAWVTFNGAGTPAIRASGNVSSITDNGVGNYTVNFTTAMPDADYTVVGTATFSGGVAWVASQYAAAPTTSAVRVGVVNNGALADLTYVNVAVFR